MNKNLSIFTRNYHLMIKSGENMIITKYLKNIIDKLFKMIYNIM